MTTYVLVGGAWLGGWCWQAVARDLRGRGHEVYPLTLTGLGDRAHLANPAVDLETHITDITSTLELEDLHDVVLVAHSYASVPVTGAADRAAERVAQVVYVDTAPIQDGTSLFDGYPPEATTFVRGQVAERGDGWRWPLPAWDEVSNVLSASLGGLDPATLQVMRERARPHPFATFTQPLRLAHPERAPLPKLAVLCSFGEAQLREWIAAGHPWGVLMQGPEWRFVELPTGHWPMFSKPAELAAILDAHRAR